MANFTSIIATSGYFFIVVSTFMSNIAIGILVLMSVVRGNWRLFWQCPLAWPIICFCGFFASSLLYTESSLSNGVSFWLKYSRLLLVPLIAPCFVKQEWRLMAIKAFLCAVLLTVVWGSLSYFAIVPNLSRYTKGSVFVNHIFTSLFVAVGVFLLLNMALIYEKKRHVYICLAIVFMLYLFFLNHGRSGQIICLVLVAYFVIVNLHKKYLLLFAMTLQLLLGGLYQYSPTFHDRWVSKITGPADAGINERVLFLQNGAQLVAKTPLFGAGIGSFQTMYTATFPDAKSITNNPHNEYINILVQGGIIGCGLFLWIIASIFYYSIRLPKLEQSIVHGVGLAFLVGCCANSWLMDFQSGYLLVLMLGLCFGAIKNNKNKDNSVHAG